MEHGDQAIRAAGGDGMSWTFDANAPNVSDFAEGKIVFAIGRAVGRVLSLQRNGSTVTAILESVQLTDVIRNGRFIMDTPVDPDKMMRDRHPAGVPRTRKRSRNGNAGGCVRTA